MDPTTNHGQHDARWGRFTVVLIAVSLSLSLPALLSGYLWDDYFFASRLIEGDAPFGYYDFGRSMRDSGLAPWWISPKFTVSFFRPLSSATLHLDFSVWNGRPLYAHLHSAAWFALLLVGAVRLVRTLLPPRVAKWAAVIFAVSASHSFTVGWISARHAVVGGAFAVWSVLHYIYWRQQGKGRDAIIALVLFGLGLLSSESTLAVAGVVLAYELAAATGNLRDRVKAAAPTLGLALVYVIAYKAAGYGAKGSALYSDPTTQPVQFLADLVPKVISIFGTFVFGVHTSSAFMPGLGWLPLVVGGVALGLLGTGLLLCWRRFDLATKRLVKWLGLATLLALGPSLASLPQGRSVILSSLAIASLACLVLKELFASRARPLQRVAPLAVGGLLCFGLLFTSPIMRLGSSNYLRKAANAELTLGKRSKPICRPGARTVLINGALLFSIHAPFVLAKHQKVTWSGWQLLSEPTNDITVTPTGAETIVVSSANRPLVNEFTIRVFRPNAGDLTPGTIIEAKHLRSRVLKNSPRGPTRMEFTIRGLQDPNRICLLYYDGKDGVLRNATLPPQGETLTIKWWRPDI